MGIQIIVNANSDDVQLVNEGEALVKEDDTVDEEPRHQRRPATKNARRHFEFDIPENTRVVGWGPYFTR